MTLKTSFQKALVTLLAVQLVFFPTFTLPSAQAAVDQSSNALAIDASKLPATNANCDSVCNMLTNTSQGSTISSTLNWVKGGQDQYCANHGSVTDVSIGPTTSNCAGPAYGQFSCCQASLDNTCNVAYCPGEKCADVNQELIHCKLHNTQAESYCEAYQAALMSKKWNYVAVSLDLAAIASCTAACFTVVNPTLIFACTASDVAASVSEIFATSQMNSSDLAKTISYMASSIGAVGGVATAIEANAQWGAKQAAKVFGPKTEEEALKAADQATKAGSTEAKGTASKLVSKMENKIACAVAALYGILLAMRMYNIKSTDDSANSSCSSLQSLMSNGTTTTPGTDLNSSNYTPTNGTAAVASFGGSSGSGTNGSSTTNSGSGGSGSTPIPLFTPCSTGQCLNVGTSAAMDSGLLSSGNKVSAIAPMANKLLQNGLASQIASGATAGQLVGGALGGSGGSFGSALANLADQAQKSPSDLASLLPANAFPPSIGTMQSGGGMNRAESAQKADDPFAALGGGWGAKGGGAATTGSMSFGTPSVVGDIWHSSTNSNIFEIISQKMGVVNSRVSSK